MGKKERAVERMLGINQGSNKNKEIVTFFDSDRFRALGQPWYVSGFWQKLIFVLSFIALCWTVIKLVFFHHF